jgi:alkanesulfonate monooxygenase SsuD/methylene tetrahydromethanopterin reductase-like flavin-dependent oxidoreductase (luciferase family)
MRTTERIRIGVGVPASAAPGDDPVALAVLAERLGYDFVSTSDHPAGTAPTFETWTMLTWIAASTSRIGIATRVLGVPYRSPAMVAKMAETLSRLSNGRLVLGLGGGYSDEEFHAFGLPVPTPAAKVTGLGEAIEVMRGLWREPAFTMAGTIHRTNAADLEPKPSQPIPIWLGTFGPKALALTGRLADGWIPSLGFADETQLVGMRARVLASAEDAGRDPAAITCALNVEVALDTDTDDSSVIAGSPAQVLDRFHTLADLGFTTFNIMTSGDQTAQADQVTRFAAEVLPALHNPVSVAGVRTTRNTHGGDQAATSRTTRKRAWPDSMRS